MVRQLLLLGSAAASLAACATTPKSCRSLFSDTSQLRNREEGGEVFAAPFNQASASVLHCAADQGNRSAQVELAKRYEMGEGVPRDVRKAVTLYERAARNIAPNTAIYSPPVRLGGRGQVLFIQNENAGPGLAEAQYRLGRLLLEGRGVPGNIRRGRSLIEQAAKQNYAPAIDYLASPRS
ncbi:MULTISPECIES: tetratricopeptide repeat protein [unclassified Sphingomonas]|jgi:TPR repeat protein|uniref:tetratricopeptide repeat protein n=1 Tax=unclassified Sphingomonas TaxID=196159 RepID=UPI0009E98F02